ncbi:MAG: hypothetical protein ACI955_002228 [Zhongshania sp.]|jgi:hypothetical protein
MPAVSYAAQAREMISKGVSKALLSAALNDNRYALNP